MPASGGLLLYRIVNAEANSIRCPLTPAERAIVKEFGGWTIYMASYGPKPWDDEDAAERLAIVRAVARDD
ncbi:hypothetical protein BJX70DRAFT_403842 [Aspergillus crustosus]